LIDLFCLYDDVAVLGRQTNAFFDQRESDFSTILEQQDFVKILDGYEDEKKVSEISYMHLRAFLGEDKAPYAEELVSYVLNPARFNFGFSLDPHRDEQFLVGQRLLRNASSVDEIRRRLDAKDYEARQITFVVRSFIYVGYSNVHQLPFTADSTRMKMLSSALDGQDELRTKLLEKLRRSVELGAISEPTELQRRISPLASIVFDRAWPGRGNIPKLMEQLRKELAPMRERLKEAENAAIWGVQAEELSAVRKWNSVFEEIEQAFGRDERLLSIRRGLNFAGLGATAIGELKKASGWAKVLLDLPVDAAQRMLARRPAIELFNLQKEIPGSARARRRIADLFGMS
jgi:hypothetical protein